MAVSFDKVGTCSFFLWWGDGFPPPVRDKFRGNDKGVFEIGGGWGYYLGGEELMVLDVMISCKL